MRILYVCPDLGVPVLGRKGAAAHVRGLVAALGRAGHSVVLAAPMLTRSPWEEPARIEAKLLHIPPSVDSTAAVFSVKAFNETVGVANSLPGELRRILYNQELATQLRRRFDSDPPDFVYERASLYATAGISLARDLDRPLVLELNAPLALEQSAYRATGLGVLAAEAECWTLKHADAVLTVSGPLRDYTLALGLEPSRVHVVPNAVDPAVFRPALPDPTLRASMGLGEGPVLGFVGGLRRWHGVDALPALLGRLLERYPDLRLVIVGDGPLRAELEQDLRERGLRRSCVFTGSVPHDDVPNLMRQFDVAVAPYPRPQHDFYFSPLKVFEYMACGIPVVAAELGQIADLVQHEQTGLLYTPADFQALTTACERLLGDPALRGRLGSAAAEEVRRQYTWDHNTARVTEIAESLIAARRVAA
jgi:glycosyltransferase involved in cell wall biosynthesis